MASGNRIARDSYYDEIAEGYDELYAQEQKKKLALVKQHFVPHARELLLDVGCGTGIATACWDASSVGIDPSLCLLQKAAVSDHTLYIQGVAEMLPFEDRSFDYVVSLTSLQNFSDIERGIFEIKRVGKGNFALSFLKKTAKKKEILSGLSSAFGKILLLEEEKDILAIIKI